MRHLSPFKTGAAVGIVIALWHACWVMLVGLGWAKPFMDFVLRLHFIQLQYQLEPYAAVTAAMLITVTFAIGFMFGLVFALIWNWLGTASSPVSIAASSTRVEA